MSAPTDVFSTQVSPALDEARTAIQEVGLRPHRVFIVIDTWSGTTRRREGSVLSTAITEVLPTPRVEFPSAARIAMSGGMLQAGSCTLRKISRVLFTEATLLGKNADGSAFPVEKDFYYALKPLGEALAAFYHPSSDTILTSTSYALDLRPLNKTGTLAGITADP